MRESLRMVLSKRAFLGLMALAALPLIFRTGMLYFATYNEEVMKRVMSLDARLFGDFLNGQIGFAILLAIFGGAGLIANDLRTGAILVYLSRPLTYRDYIAGKLGTMMALTGAVTLLPAVLLYVIALTLIPGTFRTWELAWLLPAIVGQALLISLVVSLLILAISALSTSARIAGVGFVMLYIACEILRAVLRKLTRVPETGLISIQSDLQAIGSAIFGNVVRGTPPGFLLPALVLATVIALSLLIIRKRVRAVEVIA
jgi:ABC-type transport system involved in multi-copper enzyme maturation permease subunit